MLVPKTYIGMITYLLVLMSVRPNRYLLDISSSSDDQDIVREVESETCCTRSTGSRSTRLENVRKRFRTRMQFFIANKGSCNYDAKSIGDIDFRLRYKHLVQ